MKRERGTARRHGRRTRLWFDLHSWFGVLASLLLFLVCWSGTFATLAHEIDWLLNPAQRVDPMGDPAPLERVEAVARAAYPAAAIEGIATPLYENFAYDVIIKTADGVRRHVYVDPYRLEVTGDGSFLNVQRYLRDFHRRLFAGKVGLYLVCALSIPLLFSLVTSLLFYRGWWRKFFTLPAGKNLRGWVSTLHGWLGLWALWFVLLIGLTGAWYLWEQLRVDAGDGRFVFADVSTSAVQPLPPVEAKGERLPFDDLLAAARAERPELAIGYLYNDRGGYFYVTGQAGHLLVRHRANKVFIDPFSGRVALSQRASDLSPYWRLSDSIDPLHFGDFGGLISKVIWFVFGLVLSFLSLSGAWLFARRLSRNRRYATKMRVALGLTAASAVLTCTVAPLPLFFLERSGAAAAGVALWEQLLPGTWAFIVGWIAMTTLTAVCWVSMLWKPMRRVAERSRPAAVTGRPATGY